MTERARERLLFLLLLLALGAAWALRERRAAVQERADALDAWERGFEPALGRGDGLEALSLLLAANEADPEHALERGLSFLQSWRGSGISVDRSVLALAPPDALTALPLVEPPQRPEPLPAGDPGAPSFRLVGARSDVLAEGFALLGAQPPQGDAPAVVLTDATPAPAGATRALHTLPNADPLGLGEGSDAELARCHLRTDDLMPVSRLGVQAPFDGTLRTWPELPDDVEVLAEVTCPGEEARPAVLRRGSTTVFAFDLLDVLLRWRQGDPRVAGTEVDGVPGPRPSDLFPRDLTSDDLVAPFADLWLAATLRLAEGEGPRLRIWPHPAGARSTLVVTGDQDFADEATLRVMLVALGRQGVHPTIFLTSGGIQTDGRVRLDAPSPTGFGVARLRGAHFGAHPVFPDWEPEVDLGAVLHDQQLVVERGYGAPLRSARNHKVYWPGWLEPARALVDAGVAWDASWLTVVSEHLPTLGYMTGSGLPMRFRDQDFAALPLRQIATQLDDASNPLTGTKGTGIPTLSREGFLYRGQEVLRASAGRFHAPVAVNNHPSHFLRDSAWLLGLVGTARQEGAAVTNVAGLGQTTDGLLASTVGRDGEAFVVSAARDAQDLVIFGHGGDVLVDGAVAEAGEDSRYDEPALVVRVPRGRHRVELRGPARSVEPTPAERAEPEETFPFAAPAFYRAEMVTTRDLPGLPASHGFATWNAWGVRGEPVDPSRDDQLRILTLGGSVTECLMLDDPETWPARLQALLEERTGRDVWVGNLGLSGQQTLDYTARILGQAPALRPHLVVVMPGANDLQAACEDRLLPLDLGRPDVLARVGSALYRDRRPLEQVLADARLPADAIAERTTERVVDKTRMYAEQKAARSAATDLRPAVEDLDDHLAVYGANLGQLFAALDGLDAQGVVLTHPSLWKPAMTDDELAALVSGYTCYACATQEFHTVDALRDGLERFNAETLRQCGEHPDVACLDMAPRIQRSLTNFYDDAHLTAAGAEVFARELADFLLDRELLP